MSNISSIYRRNDYQYDEQKTPAKYLLMSGVSWFTLDIGVGTIADVYHNSKSKSKLPKKELLKQIGKNAFGAGIFALIFAPPLGILYNMAKQNKTLDTDDFPTVAGIVALGAIMLFRLLVASSPHPKWKEAFSKFIDLF